VTSIDVRAVLSVGVGGSGERDRAEKSLTLV
jgi:hypothetical protein